MVLTVFWRAIAALSAVTLVAAAISLVVAEAQSSLLQSKFFARRAAEMRFEVQPGVHPAARFPTTGPYDERLGYTGIAGYLRVLGAGNYAVASQAAPSAELLDFMDRGGFAIYREKARAGLTLEDRDGETIFAARYPERVYSDFNAIPDLVVQTLLFVENRELLDPTAPNRNPAVEWDRLASSLAVLASRPINQPGARVAGASTLATQIEKYRHSPDGQTANAGAKLNQMMSASLRAYLDGPDTKAARQRIVLDYLNTTPLAARPGFGEINGLGDGLWAWFGADFDAVNRVLHENSSHRDSLNSRAAAYKQVLSLILAQRRPSHYLGADRQALAQLADSHLRVLAGAGIVDAELGEAALMVPLDIRDEAPPSPPASFVDHKGANTVRSRLLSLLGVPSLYQLDRLDLTVRTSLDAPTQLRVTDILASLDGPGAAAALGLGGYRMLDRGDPGRVVYSVALYERGAGANYLRVQADNLDRPLDINEGAKLDLGSTAKLRTLVAYLEIIAELHGRFTGVAASELEALAEEAEDPLTRWAALQLGLKKNPSLEALLDAAMQRRYSADPSENFFTGGAPHRFVNFEKSDDAKVLSVAEAIRHSVNLIFIRLMRDIVAYYIAEGSGDFLAERDHPSRQAYLERFADSEGRDFLNGFYNRYRGLTGDQALNLLATRVRPTADRLAAIFRSARPTAAPAALAAFLAQRLPTSTFGADAIAAMHAKYGDEKLLLADRGLIARVHPLELWLVGYLQDHPKANRAEIIAASAVARQETYAWLAKTRDKGAQDSRIRIVLEQEAFRRIHQSWVRLGYPFESLVPSLATAIGSSADRPAALAELMGILLNSGVRSPSVKIERLHFAAATPFEAMIEAKPKAPERVLAAEVAATARRALVDIVENGTARRVRKAFAGADGSAIPVGGKTGTGDHRFERHGAGGRLLESRVVNRTATFAFFIGECFFGTVTAHVAGPKAKEYRFTSALPVQLLKSLAPALQPMIHRPKICTEALGLDRLIQTVAFPPAREIAEPAITEPAITEPDVAAGVADPDIVADVAAPVAAETLADPDGDSDDARARPERFDATAGEPNDSGVAPQ